MLASAVNAVGAENGIPLHYDRTSVAHWLTGTQPAPPVAALVAEAFSRRLATPVSVEDTGLNQQRLAGSATGTHSDTVTGQLVLLGEAGMRRRDLLRGIAYSLLPTGIPDPVEPAALPPPAHEREKVGTVHAEAATLMLSVFSATDTAFGGGSGLPALSAYLATDVASWLRARSTPAARARLESAAARLTYLAGWMCFDDALHGAGQRYYRAAASLAAAAGDVGCHAAALRSLSVQAHYLGHHATALALADTAIQESHRVSRAEAAFLAGQLGVANAACGHTRAARDHLSTAERHLRRSSDADEPVGGYHTAALAHQQAETLAATGDRDAAIRALTLSLRHRPSVERRARAITTARLAELYLDSGRIDRACATWSTLLDDRAHLTSQRVEQAVRTMRARLRPHNGYAPARTLLTRAERVSAGS